MSVTRILCDKCGYPLAWCACKSPGATSGEGVIEPRPQSGALGVDGGWGQAPHAGPTRVTRDVASDGTVIEYGWDAQSAAPLWTKVTYPDGRTLEW